jgi:3-oxoacyl-[acyl-carrier protein] reductase
VARVTGAALVVGGASGIGRACAHSLARAGWKVVIADRRQADDGETIALDVRDREAVRAAATEIAGRHGAIGAVVYAAGTARVTPILDIGADEWDLVAGVNLTGAFNVLQACAPQMPAGASLTFMSSIDSAAPVPGLAHYCAAKAGVEALVRSAALELGERGLRCNAVLPGVVRTPLMEPMLARPEVEAAFVGQTPLGRIADGADIADVVTFLASPAARWVTGVSLPVDGGMGLREHPRILQSA